MEGGRIIGGAKVRKGAYKAGSAGGAKRIQIDEDGLAQVRAQEIYSINRKACIYTSLISACCPDRSSTAPFMS